MFLLHHYQSISAHEKLMYSFSLFLFPIWHFFVAAVYWFYTMNPTLHYVLCKTLWITLLLKCAVQINFALLSKKITDRLKSLTPATQNNPPSEDKGRKLKRRGHGKKKKKVVVTKEREDECFSCGDGGQMVSCKRPGCPKVYHADCLNLTKRPAGQWLCMDAVTQHILVCLCLFWLSLKCRTDIIVVF